MEELRPLTISNSVASAPSVLLTEDFKKYTFMQPVTQEVVLTHTIYTLLHKHFKVDTLSAGVFTLRGTKYFCAEEPESKLVFSDWLDFLWSSNRAFSRFLNPEALVRMFLINLYFPLFQTRKLILNEKKDRFVGAAFPIVETQREQIVFSEDFLGENEMTSPELLSFFRKMKAEVIKEVEDFQVLHHEGLYTDLKYQVSLYPSIRNKCWDQVKQCFDKGYRKEVDTELNAFLVRL